MTHKPSAQRDPGAEEPDLPLAQTTSLRQLRDRVETAAQELERLRRENEALTARIERLEQRPAIDAEAAFVAFDESPEAVRRKVERFIDAIDAYLAEE